MIIMNDETHWLFLLLFVWSEAPSTDTAALSALASSTVLTGYLFDAVFRPITSSSQGAVGSLSSRSAETHRQHHL